MKISLVILLVNALSCESGVIEDDRNPVSLRLKL